MGYTHFNKVSGVEAVAVGAKGSEVDIADGSGNLSHGGVALSATAAEINKAADVSGRIVTAAASTLAVTADLHAGRIILLSRLAGVTATLPAATGSGNIYTFKVGAVPTSNAHVIAAKTTDTMSGLAMMQEASAGTMLGWLIDGTDDKLTINGTTTGGETIGDTIICVDAQNTTWHVLCYLTGSGTEATPASSS